MCRIIKLLLLSNWLHLIALSIFILSIHGCAGMKSVQEEPSPFPMYPENYLEQNEFSVAKGDDIINKLAVIKLKRGIHYRTLQDTSVWDSMKSVQPIQG